MSNIVKPEPFKTKIKIMKHLYTKQKYTTQESSLLLDRRNKISAARKSCITQSI